MPGQQLLALRPFKLGSIETDSRMASIDLQGIVKDYGKVRAIHGVDLHIEDGEFVAFVGP